MNTHGVWQHTVTRTTNDDLHRDLTNYAISQLHTRTHTLVFERETNLIDMFLVPRDSLVNQFSYSARAIPTRDEDRSVMESYGNTHPVFLVF